MIERNSSEFEHYRLPAHRQKAIAEYIRLNGQGSVSDLESQFGVSAMTIRRDLHELERQGLAKRTHGGAVAPGLTAQEDSFSQRVQADVEVKERLALAAAALVKAGEVVFIDSSSSAYYVARQLIAQRVPITVITNSLPVMQLFTTADANVELTGTGGRLRSLTLSLVGSPALRVVREHFADRLFFSVKGLLADGSLTDPDPLECDVKRAMIEQAEQSVLLLQPSKLHARGAHLIARARDVSCALAADLTDAEILQLRAVELQVQAVR